MKKRPRHVVILGKKWRFIWRRPAKKHNADVLTDCDKKTIRIDPNLPPLRMLEVVTHELDHAVTDSMDETRAYALSEAVAAVAVVLNLC